MRKLCLRYPGIQVTGNNRFDLMVVTPIAGIFRVGLCVADLAGDLSAAAVLKREIVHMQFCWRPCLGGMAVLAL